MEVYVVWRDHHAPLEVFSTQRKAAHLIEELSRAGVEAFFTRLVLNDATPKELNDG